MITVQTFNIQHGINYLKKNIDLPLMSRTISDCGGQIVCLNEVYGRSQKPDLNKQADIISGILGYNNVFAAAINVSGSGEYGNALISKYPIVSYEVKPVTAKRIYPEYYEKRCIINAVVDVCGKKLRVLCTHMGLAPNERENSVTVLCNMIDSSDIPVILMGDFNMSPGDKMLNPIRARLFDTAEMIEGDGYTFPSDNPKEKIDYIFVSRDIKVTAAKVPAIIASDHRPVTADIEF